MANIKLLDFWAPWCIDPETLVLTKEGYLKASQVHIGDKVLTIDPETYQEAFNPVKKTRVFKHMPSKKIVLETGNYLIGDTNHLVLTKEGFKQLSQVSTQDKVLVNPALTDTIYPPKNSETILKTTGNDYADINLKKQGLLPLKANNVNLSILARLLGFVMTDGYLYEDKKHNIYETHFIVGTKQDTESIKEDLNKLGINKVEITYRSNNRHINGRDFTISTYRCRNHNRALFFLLKALGSPVGRKKNQAYFIPDWIMNAGRDVKKEFLGGWLGGNGCKIDYYVRHESSSSHEAGFRVNAIEFHKEKDLKEEGVLYAQQLTILLEELGVKVGEIVSFDDEDGVVISIRVATDYLSLLNLCSIGYRYSYTKNRKVPLIKEFIRYRLFERSNYQEIKRMVLEQLALGISNASVAQSMQIPFNTVVSWKYTNRQLDRVYPPKNGEARFDLWLEDREEQGLLWEKVVQVKDVENRDVVGISVDNPHTLVTNGIVSHNCGPCKAMDPIIEELEKELEGKIEIEKINVDEEPAKASEFGVMGIPTYVVIKDGKEAGRKVGMTSKDDLKSLLSA